MHRGRKDGRKDGRKVSNGAGKKKCKNELNKKMKTTANIVACLLKDLTDFLGGDARKGRQE